MAIEPTASQVHQGSLVTHLSVEEMEELGDRWRDALPGDYDFLQFLCRQLLYIIGEDADRPGLVDTPRRFARFWREFMVHDPGKLNVGFESVTVDQMVVVSGIRVWSLCEHHLVPFWCELDMAYIADKTVLGLSKFARIAHKHAHRLQLQERLVHDIADEIQAHTESDNVAVVGRGVHLCMVMRGVKTEGTMGSSVLRGKFRDDPLVRSEFLQLVGQPAGKRVG